MCLHFVVGFVGRCLMLFQLSLTWWPLCRDTFFYSVGLLMIIGSFFDSKIQIWEPILLFCWYLAYCTFMAFNEKIELFVKENFNCDACGKLCQGDSDVSFRLQAPPPNAHLLEYKRYPLAHSLSTGFYLNSSSAVTLGVI